MKQISDIQKQKYIATYTCNELMNLDAIYNDNYNSWAIQYTCAYMEIIILLQHKDHNYYG